MEKIPKTQTVKQKPPKLFEDNGKNKGSHHPKAQTVHVDSHTFPDVSLIELFAHFSVAKNQEQKDN